MKTLYFKQKLVTYRGLGFSYLKKRRWYEKRSRLRDIRQLRERDKIEWNVRRESRERRVLWEEKKSVWSRMSAKVFFW